MFWTHQWLLSVQPAGITLTDHLEHRPPSEHQREINIGGQKFLVLFGTIQIWPRFPSGAPVYIFDGTRKLVDWTPDIGDDEAFKARWPNMNSGVKPLSHDEVAKWPDS